MIKAIEKILTVIVLFLYFLHVSFAQSNVGDEYYEKAYTEIANMLDGKTSLSLHRAVFIAEWA